MEKTLPAIPAKRYFTIGEVSELCGVKPYVLRYWEQEFTQLKPMKRRGNRRYYQHHEVLLIRRIRELLYDQGFTISGARNRLSDSVYARKHDAVDAELDGTDLPLDLGLDGDDDEAVDGAPMATTAPPALRSATAAQSARRSSAAASRDTEAASRSQSLPHETRLLTPSEVRAELAAIRELLAG
jgi:DNA-binding transcriptional MerR regulator